MDRIYIRDLTLRCIVGIRPEDTVNIGQLERRIAEFVESSQFQLIERLAEGIAGICLQDPKVASVTVGVDKPRALRFARSAGVEITRRQGCRKTRSAAESSDPAP